MNTKKSILALASVFAMRVFGQQVVPNNGFVYEAQNFDSALALQSGHAADGSEILCSYAQDNSGRLQILREKDVLVSEGEFPTGVLMGYRPNSTSIAFGYGCSQSGVYVLGYDTSQLVGTFPATGVYIKPYGGSLQPILRRNQTQFPGVNPRNGQQVTYTHLQTLGLKVSQGRVLAYVQLQPSGSAEPVQFGIIEWKDGTWRLLFSFSQSSPAVTYISSIYCATQTKLYVTLRTQTQTGLDIYRVDSSGQFSKIQSDLLLKGAGLSCLAGGAQIYDAVAEGGQTLLRYSYLDDNASATEPFFAGTSVQEAVLSGSETYYPLGSKSLDVMTSAGAWVRLMDGKTILVRLPSQNPYPNGKGMATAVVSGRLYYLEADNIGRTYRVYQPQLSKTAYSVRPGEELAVTGTDLALGGQLPSVSLPGTDYTVSSSGVIKIQIPSGAEPGFREGIITVWGIRLPFTVTVQPKNPVPVITAVVNGTFPEEATPLSPRMHATAFFSGGVGTEAIAGAQASFELGGISAEMCGKPVRLIYNSGHGQLNFTVPSGTPDSCQFQITAHYGSDGNTVSEPATVAIFAWLDSLFPWTDQNGNLLPILTDSEYRLVGSLAQPAKMGQVVVGWGTGCKLPSSISDDQNTPASGLETAKPLITIGGSSAEVLYTGLAGGFVGLCQYNFKIPADILPGLTTMRLGPASLGPSYKFFVQ